jgi:microcystin-dependent protein
MWSGRRKSMELNKVLYHDNRAKETTWLLNDHDVYNDNTGNVGIGIKMPKSKLDVVGTINTSSDFTINHVSIAPPIGSITAYTLATSPPGWLICDGSAISRTTYASLFAVIGVTFGSGNNSTTFNLPNYQGAFLRGTGTTGDYSGPSLNASQAHATQTHTHTASSVITDPGHAHSQTTNNDDFNNSGGNTFPGSSNPSFAANDTGSDRTWTNINSSFTGVTVNTTIGNSTTSVNMNETRPYNFGVTWIIKY